MINELYRCINCRFHESADNTCRRYAPKPWGYSHNWSMVEYNDWCGDFEFKLGEVVQVKQAE